MIARSVTVRASGPATSCVCESGMMPSRLESPIVGRNPNRSSLAAGLRMDPQVSVPIPAAAKLAATAAPVPPLDPPGLRRRSYGLRVCPPSELTVVMPYASSCRFVLPRMMAPAPRSCFTWKASVWVSKPCSATDPPVVGMSAVA